MANGNRRSDPRARGGRSAWPGFVILIAAAVLAGLIYWIVTQPRIAANPNGPTKQNGQQVAFSNLKVTPANGAFRVTGQATNKTNQPITALSVQLSFNNLSGKTLENEEVQLKNEDGADLQVRPIQANATQPIAATVNHVPAGWNEEPPRIAVVNVENGGGSTAGAAAQPSAGSDANTSAGDNNYNSGAAPGGSTGNNTGSSSNAGATSGNESQSSGQGNSSQQR